METAVLLLGSNLGNRAENLENAISRMERTIGRVLNTSSVYESEPWGMKSASNFYNQCVSLSTSLDPSSLLNQIHALEQKMGREVVRTDYTDRTIDIDILFYGDREVSEKDLTIPHSRIRERKFTLIPLLEIYPDFVYPSTGEKLQEILDSCNDKLSVRKIP